MRIKEIRIEGLFDMFNHTIPLNLDSHLSIIYGINGVGKTMIFKILSSLFNLKRDSLKATMILPFKTLIVNFEGGSSLVIDKKNNEVDIIFENLQGSNLWTFEYPYNFSSSYHISDIDYLLEPVVKGLRKNAFHQYFYAPASEIMKPSSVVENFIEEAKERIPASIYDSILLNHTGFPVNLYYTIAQINIVYISTERLFFHNINDKSIVAYSNDIANIIYEKKEDYDRLSNELQSSLSQRLLNKEINTSFSAKQLIDIQREVKEKYNQLKAVGILGDEKYYPFEINDSINDIDKAVLAVNLQDMQTKLKVFDKLYEKLFTFLEILNQRRLSYKQLSISAKEGFIFTNSKGKNLIPTDLSSGEQHELVLLYLLLFKIPKNSLILIDEPEISLHIDWQMDFLSDLEDIIRLRNFDILLSTHSPSIINGHSELTISLDGKD